MSAFCDKYNHTRDECGEKGQGTVIKTGNLKVLAIIDGDSLIGDQAKSADCIVLALHKKHRIVAIIELKSKVVYAEDVVRKIQETTNFLTGIMKELSFSPDKTSFYPIIFSKRIRSVESPQFLKPANRVTFLGKKYFVARKRYDVPLSDIIAVLST